MKFLSIKIQEGLLSVSSVGTVKPLSQACHEKNCGYNPNPLHQIKTIR